LRAYVLTHTTNRIDVILGSRLFAHLLRLPLAYFEARRVGDTVARVRELETLREFMTGSTLTLIVDLLFTVVFFVVLFLYSPLLAGVVAAGVPLYVTLSAVITPVLRSRLNDLFDRGAENQAFLVESVNGIQTLKSMAAEPLWQRQWEERLAAYVSTSMKTRRLGIASSEIAAFINKVTVVLILWIGATLVMRGELTVGQLVAFNMIAARISGPILRLVQLWQDLQQAGISMRRLGDILNVPGEAGRGKSRTGLPALRGGVRFERVGFRYRADEPRVLEDIDIAVRPGEVIGIVGHSGSGKSTLTRLVQRLNVPDQGRVFVDDVDLALVDPAWLRRQIGVVLQENVLFNRSIRDNIALVDPSAPIETVVHAARLAAAHDFIMALPQGYDTPVGEHGGNLSGGQRQRIAIARALLGDPRILIFDEATSALDYESELLIHRNMQAMCRDRTVFIIAHRLSAVQAADRILVMQQGRIAEQGDHDSLMSRQGIYARLHALQAGPRAVRGGQNRVVGERGAVGHVGDDLVGDLS
jgi:subfamily B ATP-binding cassette protein HlyB/CyaB